MTRKERVAAIRKRVEDSKKRLRESDVSNTAASCPTKDLIYALVRESLMNQLELMEILVDDEDEES